LITKRIVSICISHIGVLSMIIKVLAHSYSILPCLTS